MKTITLKFDCNDREEEAEALRAIQANAMQNALWRIEQEIFRPARKHGYGDQRLDAMLETCGDLVDELSKRFYEILDDEGIKL